MESWTEQMVTCKLTLLQNHAIDEYFTSKYPNQSKNKPKTISIPPKNYIIITNGQQDHHAHPNHSMYHRRDSSHNQLPLILSYKTSNHTILQPNSTQLENQITTTSKFHFHHTTATHHHFTYSHLHNVSQNSSSKCSKVF